jgi:hypothetical protein
VGAEVCFIGDTNPIVTKSVCTAIGDGSITAWGDSGFGGISPIHATNINLALGKPATQSSTFPYHSILPVAGYAVDGNTDGFVDKCGC